MFKTVTRKVTGLACFCDLCGRESYLLLAAPNFHWLRDSEGWLEKKWLAKTRQSPLQMYECYQFCPDCAVKIRRKNKMQILAMIKDKGVIQ